MVVIGNLGFDIFELSLDLAEVAPKVGGPFDGIGLRMNENGFLSSAIKITPSKQFTQFHVSTSVFFAKKKGRSSVSAPNGPLISLLKW
jgi:hypothetical protein